MNFFVYTASVLVKKSKNRRNGSRNFYVFHIANAEEQQTLR
jgi:hypothetical protein